MSHAQVCPICNGEGKIPKPKGQWTTSTLENSEICYGCGGRGWVEVSDN